MSSTTVYAIASGKGGVGKTTTTVNLGTALAGAGHRVAIVDTDLGMANLAGFVNLSPDGPTLHDVLAGEATVPDATYEVAERIGAIPSGTELSGFAEADATELSEVIDRLREEFDYVLLDVGAGISHESVLPLGLADETILVSTPEPASVQDVKKTIDLTERSGGDVAGLVLTRTRSGDKVSYDEIAARLDIPLFGTIPEDDAVRDSVYARTPLVVNTPDSPAATAYRALAADLVGDAVDPDAPTASSEGTDDSGDGTDAEQPASSTDVSDALSDVDDAPDETETDDADDLPDEDLDLSLDEDDDAVVEAETDAVEATTEGVDDPSESFDRGASSDDEGVTIPDAEDDAEETDSSADLDDEAIPFRGGDSGAEAAAGDDVADDDGDGSTEAVDDDEAAAEETDDADADEGDDEKDGKGFLGGLF